MKVVVACGGTGGHTFPGLAVAEELRRQGHEVTVWGSGRDVEASVLKHWDGPVFATGAKPLRAANAFALLRSIWRCRRELKRNRPEAMLAMGSYSSLPPVLAARLAKVRVVLHEANTVPGRAVEFLARFADTVAISFAETEKYLRGVNTIRTGLPVRAGIADGQRLADVPQNAFVVFVTGGSQGAHAVNLLLKEALVLFKSELALRGETARPLYVIHQTGQADEAEVTATYTAAGIAARVRAFEDDMAGAFASASVVVARAGASTCFELAATGVPAFFIPLPSAMRNHQHFNAEVFVRAGAADEGTQDRLTPRSVCHYLLGKYDHPEQLATMAAKMRLLATMAAAAELAALVTLLRR